MDKNTPLFGFCQCGCGQITGIAPYSRSARGWVRGHPQPYAFGHSSRIRSRVAKDGRLCSGCRRPLPLSEFKKDKRSADGYASWCRDCNSADRRAWYAVNAARERANVAAWRADNPEKVRAQLRHRYALRRGAAGRASAAQIAARVAFYGGRCAYCGGTFDHLDHVIPLSRGGSQWPANLRPSCESCNTRKNDMPWREWFALKHGRNSPQRNTLTIRLRP